MGAVQISRKPEGVMVAIYAMDETDALILKSRIYRDIAAPTRVLIQYGFSQAKILRDQLDRRRKK